MKDNRDPQLLGEALLRHRDPEPLTASQRYDRYRDWFERAIPNFDDGNPGPLERYGDPRLRHVERES